MKALRLWVRFLPYQEGDWLRGMERLSRPRRCMSHKWRTARKKIRRLRMGLEFDTYIRSKTSGEKRIAL